MWYFCIFVMELCSSTKKTQQQQKALKESKIYLCCRRAEHFPCTFGIEIPVNFGIVLKISSWWFHPLVVIIFADYAPHDSCICLWISHHMQMLMWPIAFLSCLYHGHAQSPARPSCGPACAVLPCRAEMGGGRRGTAPPAGWRLGGTCCRARLPASLYMQN